MLQDLKLIWEEQLLPTFFSSLGFFVIFKGVHPSSLDAIPSQERYEQGKEIRVWEIELHKNLKSWKSVLGSYLFTTRLTLLLSLLYLGRDSFFLNLSSKNEEEILGKVIFREDIG